MIPESVGTEDDGGAKKGGGAVGRETSAGLPPVISISSSSSAIGGRTLLRFRLVTRGEERGVGSRACGGVDGGMVGKVDAGSCEEESHRAGGAGRSRITAGLSGESLGSAAGLTFSLGFGRAFA